jgi:hypothetical protein
MNLHLHDRQDEPLGAVVAPGLLAVQLTETQWQLVVNVLGTAPFNTVAPLISAIMRQVKPQMEGG